MCAWFSRWYHGTAAVQISYLARYHRLIVNYAYVREKMAGVDGGPESAHGTQNIPIIYASLILTLCPCTDPENQAGVSGWYLPQWDIYIVRVKKKRQQAHLNIRHQHARDELRWEIFHGGKWVIVSRDVIQDISHRIPVLNMINSTVAGTMVSDIIPLGTKCQVELERESSRI